MAEFTLKRGDAWNQDFIYQETEAGPAINLEGVSAALQLKDLDGALILDASPYLTVNGAAGTVTVAVPRAQTRLFPIDRLQFDIELSADIASTETMYLNIVEDVTVLP